MSIKTLLILAGAGGLGYYLYTEGEKKKPVELSQKSKDMRVAKAASQAAIAAGTYKGSARMQRLKAQQAAAQAKKTATFTPSASSPTYTGQECPEGWTPSGDGCSRDAVHDESAESIQAGNEAMATQQDQQTEEVEALLTEALGRNDLRAVKDTLAATMDPRVAEKTYEEWIAEVAQAADDPSFIGSATMLAAICAQDPTGSNCRVANLLQQTAQMAKAEVAKKNSGLALAAIGLPVLGLFLVMPLAVVPWVVKQFKPEWSYGKRVATGFVVSFGLGAVTKIAKAGSGTSSSPATAVA